MKETIYIRNMVCNRCIMVVTQEFEKAGLKPGLVKMGEVELLEKPSAVQLDKITTALHLNPTLMRSYFGERHTAFT